LGHKKPLLKGRAHSKASPPQIYSKAAVVVHIPRSISRRLSPDPIDTQGRLRAFWFRKNTGWLPRSRHSDVASLKVFPNYDCKAANSFLVFGVSILDSYVLGKVKPMYNIEPCLVSGSIDPCLAQALESAGLFRSTDEHSCFRLPANLKSELHNLAIARGPCHKFVRFSFSGGFRVLQKEGT